MKTNVYAVILAGGSGTRFWPLSRKSRPKQFLNITGNRSLLQETLRRVKTKIKAKNILIVTGAKHAKEIKRQVKPFRIPSSNLLFEPQGKNTAPAVGWAASHINKRDAKATMIVLPADHLILKQKAFWAALQKAMRLAQEGALVTLGIVPTRPETGYGYLKTRKISKKGKKFFKVEQFIEKPDLKKAVAFLKSGKYLWNSGMFIWRVDSILKEYKKRQPKIFNILASGRIKQRWGQMPNISVDYGILERAKDIAAVSGQDIGWSDLGSWESVHQVLGKDKKGNVLKGHVMDFGSRDTLVLGTQRLIATVGLENIVIVQTEDSLLVCRKDLSQKVKEVAETLKKKRKKES